MKATAKLETSKTCVNPDEACIVLALVDALTEGGVLASDIGVISPFRDQVALLRRALLKQAVEVSTVDQFQGRDKSVIIYSCTKRDDAANDKKVKEGEVLNDQRRLAVGVTRAKHKLLVVGNSTALQRYEPLKRLIEFCPSLVLELEVIKRLVDKYRTLVS
ncbi:DNA replication ATP-dependent helicase/nuclease DNA2-like [Choristoneura fumiferana]|uniref:DNA replication ATP-dependent helicase/nuclease DNA2-like n=1 Tax=Choristoneura fumiferana TaxID=7141 RepID=UPI003D15EF90